MKYLLDTKDYGYAGEMDTVYWIKNDKVEEGRVQEVRIEYGEFYEAVIDNYGYCMNSFDFQQTFYHSKENAEEALKD